MGYELEYVAQRNERFAWASLHEGEADGCRILVNFSSF